MIWICFRLCPPLSDCLFFFFNIYFLYFFGCIGSLLRHTGSSSRHAGSSLQRVGSSLGHAGFSLVVVCGFSLSSCGAQAPERVRSVVCSTRALSLRYAGLVARPGIEPESPCIGRQILYHWTSREVPDCLFIFLMIRELWA